ncbi:MAG: FecR family protein [Sphingobacterium sp.]
MINTEEILLGELIAALIRGQELTLEEDMQLKALLHRYPEAKLLFHKLLDEGKIQSNINWAEFNTDDQWTAFQHFRQSGRQRKKTLMFRPWLIGVAASLVFLVGLYTFWALYFNGNQPAYIVKDNQYGQLNDVLPGSNAAILQLGDGRQVLLDSLHPTVDLKGVHVANNQLVYGSSMQSEGIIKHKLVTPSRAIYQVRLSDGTRVWLNSKSELEYNPNFDKKERLVYLKGEAYFDIAHDAARPFIVESAGLKLQALGTEFNVSSYQNNSRIALTEGKLKISSSDQDVVILAGKEVRLENKRLSVYEIRDMEEITAWKNGYFYFGNKDLKQTLDEIERWYGVTVVVEKGVNVQRQYDGGMKKDVSLASLCEALSYLTGYKYVIEQNKLIVKPK